MKPQAIIRVFWVTIFFVLSAAAQTSSQAPQLPLTRVQVVALLAGDVPSSRVTLLVQQGARDRGRSGWSDCPVPTNFPPEAQATRAALPPWSTAGEKG